MHTWRRSWRWLKRHQAESLLPVSPTVPPLPLFHNLLHRHSLLFLPSPPSPHSGGLRHLLVEPRLRPPRRGRRQKQKLLDRKRARRRRRRRRRNRVEGNLNWLHRSVFALSSQTRRRLCSRAVVVAVVVIRGRKAIHESECEFEFEFECECEFKSEWVIWDLSLLNEGVNVRLC